ncbi:MAG: cytochrome c oxidase subunit 3 [Planctomycetota bacterium]
MSESLQTAALPPSSEPQTPRIHHVPPGTRELGMWLFLLTLALLFGASMIAYGVFRWTATFERENLPAVTGAAQDLGQALPMGSIAIPWPLWLSTVVIVATGFLMQRALDHVKAERIAQFRNTLVATLAMSVVFVLIQTPALTLLLLDREVKTANGAMVGFLVFLIVLHALHVIGGLVPLFKITLNAHAGKYDHEHYAPVKMITMYWHFLDAVWIVMFGVFFALR